MTKLVLIGTAVGAALGWVLGYFIVYIRLEMAIAEAAAESPLAAGLARMVMGPTDVAFAPDTILVMVLGAIAGAIIGIVRSRKSNRSEP